LLEHDPRQNAIQVITIDALVDELHVHVAEHPQLLEIRIIPRERTVGKGGAGNVGDIPGGDPLPGKLTHLLTLLD
jgi:hypothetical protein